MRKHTNSSIFLAVTCLAVALCVLLLGQHERVWKPKLISENFKPNHELQVVSSKSMQREIQVKSTKSKKQETKPEQYFHHNSNFTKEDFVKGATKWILSNTNADADTARRIAAQAWTKKHGMLLLAMAMVESEFRPHLKHANNYGLCQVSTVHLAGEEQRRVKKMGYKNMRDCGVSSASDLFDINRNLCAADAIFDRVFVEANRNPRNALVKYNANPRLKYKYSAKVWRKYKDLEKTIKNI